MASVGLTPFKPAYPTHDACQLVISLLFPFSEAGHWHAYLVVLRRQDDVVVQLELSLVVALQRLEVDNQVVLDSEDGIGRQPGVVLGVQLGGATLVLRVRNLEKQRVSRAVVWETRDRRKGNSP